MAKRRPSPTHSQLFPVYSDWTYFEFYTYGNQIWETSQTRKGGLQEARGFTEEEYVVFEACVENIRECDIKSFSTRDNKKDETAGQPEILDLPSKWVA